MLENAERYRFDIQTDDDASYFWKLRDPQGHQWHKSGSFEDKQVCLDSLASVIRRRNFWNIPIYDEGTLLGSPQGESDLDLVLKRRD